jgi:hypothetical protein
LLIFEELSEEVVELLMEISEKMGLMLDQRVKKKFDRFGGAMIEQSHILLLIQF